MPPYSIGSWSGWIYLKTPTSLAWQPHTPVSTLWFVPTPWEGNCKIRRVGVASWNISAIVGPAGIETELNAPKVHFDSHFREDASCWPSPFPTNQEQRNIQDLETKADLVANLDPYSREERCMKHVYITHRTTKAPDQSSLWSVSKSPWRWAVCSGRIESSCFDCITKLKHWMVQVTQGKELSPPKKGEEILRNLDSSAFPSAKRHWRIAANGSDTLRAAQQRESLRIIFPWKSCSARPKKRGKEVKDNLTIAKA